MSATEIMLVDLSSIAHPVWHMSAAEPDPNATSQKIVARVRGLAGQHPHAAICCDAGRSFRKDLAPSYKANRPESDATLQHQIRLACEQLEADGFPIWKIAPFEADDLIGSAVALAIADGHTALVVSADKDLLQLVGGCVRQMRPDTGAVLDAEGVFTRFGVTPTQMVDYLSLVGDASDNIKGADGIGPKKAAELLAKYGSLDIVYAGLDEHPSQFKPAMAASLREFRSRWADVRTLITLRLDAPVPFEEALKERVAKDTETFMADAGDDMETVTDEATTEQPDLEQSPLLSEAALAGHPQTALAVREADLPAPGEWQLQLDPRSMKDARTLATDMHQSRLFSAYGTPQGVLSSIMLGRELGLPAMASLRQIHIIEGRHALSSSLMVALVLKSGFAEYFEPIEFDETHAIFETKRKGARNPVRIAHTIEMARTAGLVKDKSNWMKVPTDMLVARAQSRLARMVYPDIIGGLYSPDELLEARAEQLTDKVA